MAVRMDKKSAGLLCSVASTTVALRCAVGRSSRLHVTLGNFAADLTQEQHDTDAFVIHHQSTARMTLYQSTSIMR